MSVGKMNANVPMLYEGGEIDAQLFNCGTLPRFCIAFVGSSTFNKMANKLDLADASLLGHANASKGYSLKNLVQTIGMTKSEWVKWKDKYPTKGYFTQYEIQEIDEYFGVRS